MRARCAHTANPARRSTNPSFLRHFDVVATTRVARGGTCHERSHHQLNRLSPRLAVAASACSKKEEAAKPAATQPAAAAKPAAKAAHAVGDEVEVEWKGHWYKAKVLAVNGEKFKIHYEGWTDKWTKRSEAIASASRRTKA